MRISRPRLSEKAPYNKGGNVSSAKSPGRLAGLLYILISIPGFFAMVYVPSKLIVHGNAAATANNIAASRELWRSQEWRRSFA
jgi:hypothetical protein